MAKGRKREGELFYGSNRRLPLTHESVLSVYLDSYRQAPAALSLSQDYHVPLERQRKWTRFIQYGFPSAPRYSRAEGRTFDLLRMLTPSRVRFCVQRKARREVLFALGRAGYSGSAPRSHYRRSGSSLYKC